MADAGADPTDDRVDGDPTDGADPDRAAGAGAEAPPALTPEQLERRRSVIDAAFELGAEGGYEAVQMRDVAITANVALATIYRLFSSKDHLLAAAMTEWTTRLSARVAQSPPRGDTAEEQMVDVLHRACRAMERQPKLSAALVRSLSSADAGVRDSGSEVRRSIAAMGDRILADLDPQVRDDIVAVLSHVWYSSLMGWANGRSSFDRVNDELERACRVLIRPYERPGA